MKTRRLTWGERILGVTPKKKKRREETGYRPEDNAHAEEIKIYRIKNGYVMQRTTKEEKASGSYGSVKERGITYHPDLEDLYRKLVTATITDNMSK